MSEEEDIVLEISEQDKQFMLEKGFIEENEKGEFWLTKKGEEFIYKQIGEALEGPGDAE